MIVAFATLGSNQFMSWEGVSLTVCLDLVIYCTLWRPTKHTIAILLTAAWFSLFFMLPRLAAFLIFPADKIGFVAVEPFTRDEIVGGLIYIIIGYVALWVGCEIGGRMLRPQDGRDHRPRSLSLWGIAGFFLLALLASIFVSYGLGVSVYSVDPTKWGSRLGWLTRVFDTDAALVLLLTWLVMNPKRTKPETIVAITLVSLWLLFIVSVGSRGGPLRILLFTGWAAFAVYGNFLITTRRLLGAIAIGFVASALMYAPASIIRLQADSGDAAIDNFSEQWLRPGLVKDDLQSVSAFRREWVTSPTVQKIAGAASPVITRLGLVDYPIIIVARPADSAVIDKYLKSPHALQNFANNMVPGELFPDSDVMTSRVFTMAFRGYSEAHVRSNFLSEPWTLWGFSWLVGGGMIGGTLIIVFLSSIIQAGYNLLGRVTGPAIAPYAATAYLIMPVASGLLQLFGVDHWLTITAHFAISMSVGILIAATLGWAFSLANGDRSRQ